MGIGLFKFHFKNKIIECIYMIFIICVITLTNSSDLKYIDGVIKGCILIESFCLFNRNVLITYIQFGKTRKEFFKHRLNYSIIMTLFFTILSSFIILYCKEELLSSYLLVIKVFIKNFFFYLMCFSLEMFIIILGKSQYVAIEYGMIFFYAILAIRFSFSILFNSDLDKFLYFCLSSMAIIILNLTMSHIALKTVEIK